MQWASNSIVLIQGSYFKYITLNNKNLLVFQEVDLTPNKFVFDMDFYRHKNHYNHALYQMETLLIEQLNIKRPNKSIKYNIWLNGDYFFNLPSGKDLYVNGQLEENNPVYLYKDSLIEIK
jgi:hypothetical protein